MASDRVVSILIAALGGEGGGVLTGWVTKAVAQADFPVQNTSIPGVAQRTGATTYYIELLPRTHAELAGRRPIMGLYPSPGAVDLVVSSELIEAGRAIENGYVSGDRTTLITATHRIYSTAEKSAMADGRIDADRVLSAAKEMPARALLLDTAGDASLRALPLNAVLLGAIAASGVVPVPHDNFRQAIRASGIAVEANLRGFERGIELVSAPPGAQGELASVEPASVAASPASLAALVAEAAGTVPPDCVRTAELGVERCHDYQDLAYAELYLQRLLSIANSEFDRPRAEPHPLTDQVARQLALWMTYEDTIRVADLKTRPDRFDTVRREVQAKPGETVRVRDYFKPGPDELAALLPPSLGRRLTRWHERRGFDDRWHVPLHLNSAGIVGFTLMWTLARLRRLRRRGYRYAEEQTAIEEWLAIIRLCAPRSHAFAIEVARLPELLKGYSDTHRRGLANYRTIVHTLVRPCVDDHRCDLDALAGHLEQARRAALADPEGDALARALEQVPIGRYHASAEKSPMPEPG